MNPPPNPLLRHAKREAALVMVLWLAALVWTVVSCYLHGYQHAPDAWVVRHGLATPRTAENLRTILGMPDWAFWGVFVPWLVCTVATVGFSLFVMRDDPLGEE